MASPGIALLEKTTAAEIDLANVLYEKKNGIAYVTVNRPKVLNALNTPTWKDLRTAFEDARDDAAIRGVDEAFFMRKFPMRQRGDEQHGYEQNARVPKCEPRANCHGFTP